MSEERCKKHAAVFDHRIVVEIVDESECQVCNPQICAKGIDTDLVRNCADEYPDKTQKIEDLCDEIDTLREQLAQEQRDHDATKAELARMREALEEYADRDNWSVYPAEGEKDCVWWQLDGEGWEVAEKALDGIPVDATQKRYWQPQVGDMVSISACTLVDRYGEDIKSYHQQIVEFVTVDDHKFAKLSEGNVVYLHWLNLSREEGTTEC